MEPSATLMPTPAKMKRGRPPRVDWSECRRLYATTSMTDRELAEATGRSVAAIRQDRYSNPDLWAKDHRRELANATFNALLRASQEAQLAAVGDSAAVKAAALSTEKQIEATVAMNVAIIKRHRSDITKAADLVTTMLAEVSAAGLAQADIDLTIAILQHSMPDATEAEVRVAAETIRKATQLDSRAKVLGQLAETMVKLQLAERKAYNLDTARETDDEDFVERMRLARDRTLLA